MQQPRRKRAQLRVPFSAKALNVTRVDDIRGDDGIILIRGHQEKTREQICYGAAACNHDLKNPDLKNTELRI